MSVDDLSARFAEANRLQRFAYLEWMAEPADCTGALERYQAANRNLAEVEREVEAYRNAESLRRLTESRAIFARVTRAAP